LPSQYFMGEPFKLHYHKKKPESSKVSVITSIKRQRSVSSVGSVKPRSRQGLKKNLGTLVSRGEGPGGGTRSGIRGQRLQLFGSLEVEGKKKVPAWQNSFFGERVQGGLRGRCRGGKGYARERMRMGWGKNSSTEIGI